MTTAEAVAEYLVRLGHERGTPINNSQLQRLLYYVQAWHLALHDRPLFPDRFQAWIYGPAIPHVYWTYDVHGWQPIPDPERPPALPECDAAFIREIADDYLGLDEWELQDLACNEAPWLNARGGIPHVDPSTVEISEDDMRAFYRSMEAAA
jgi:uncharacterized phage-associated protein